MLSKGHGRRCWSFTLRKSARARSREFSGSCVRPYAKSCGRCDRCSNSWREQELGASSTLHQSVATAPNITMVAVAPLPDERQQPEGATSPRVFLPKTLTGDWFRQPAPASYFDEQ